MPHILLAMDIRRNFDTFLKQKYKFSFHLKDEQLEILENIVIHKKHTLGILPTGFGKSICYVLPPLLINSKSIALIITPLVSLMTSQCQKYDAMGISSAMVKSCKDMTEETISGMLSVIIARLSDIPMFYVQYLTMHMHAGVIRQLLYGCVMYGR